MLTVSVLVFCLVGLGMLAMGYKYLTATPPIDYHADILSGREISDETVLVLGALYKVMGASFAAMGVAGIMIAVFGVSADLFWAKLALLLLGSITGWFAVTAPRHVEAKTGVKTPWRIGAALTGLNGLGFVVSII